MTTLRVPAAAPTQGPTVAAGHAELTTTELSTPGPTSAQPAVHAAAAALRTTSDAFARAVRAGADQAEIVHLRSEAAAARRALFAA